jgi:hypothetical protein
MLAPTETDRRAGRIDWPSYATRTPPGERERTMKFRVSVEEALDDIETELCDRLGVRAYRISTAAPHCPRNGRPHPDASPTDPGVVVRWTHDGRDYCVACDHYDRLRDNVRTVGLWIAETRKRMGRPVETERGAFAAAALPEGDGSEDGEGRDVVVAEPADPQTPPHEVLGVAPDAPEPVVRGAARQLKAEAHPDKGGSRDEFKRIERAERALLDDR